MDNTLKKLIESDFYRHYSESKPQALWRIRNVSLYCTIIHRRAHHYSKKSGLLNKLLSIYWRYRLNYVSRKYLFQVPYTVEIEFGFNFVHFGRLIIAPNVKIGNNCNIFTGVTIGSTTRGPKRGVPTIGNNVWIGPNAVVVGGIKIEDNVLIAGNSYVNFDVPANSIVIGNPGKVIDSLNATEGYICQQYLHYE